MIYDVAVIGTGPAGFSAALNLKIRHRNFIWIGSSTMSDKAGRAECVLNYPGLAAVSGAQLNEAFRAQAQAMELEITGQMVNSVIAIGGHYALMAGSEYYEAKALILATGASPAAVLPGEEALLGRGVSYCATCDGNLYRGRKIAVVCTHARFEPEVRFLAERAQKVYYFPLYRNGSFGAENVEIVSSGIRGILGEDRVTGVSCADGRTLEVSGVFCLREFVAFSSLLPELKTENGSICVDRSMATNLPGVFAAGDCTGRPYQYAKAAGEGNVAAHSVLAYLESLEAGKCRHADRGSDGETE